MPKTAPKTAHIDNFRDAHKAGKVWVRTSVSGGPVCLKGKPVGSFKSVGAWSPIQAMALNLLIWGLNPLKVHQAMLKDGYVNEDGTWKDEE